MRGEGTRSNIRVPRNQKEGENAHTSDCSGGGSVFWVDDRSKPRRGLCLDGYRLSHNGRRRDYFSLALVFLKLERTRPTPRADVGAAGRAGALGGRQFPKLIIFD
jgi:hypothetical protein